MEESLSMLQKIQDQFELQQVDIREYSPLTLAYIGDGIYEVVIRTILVSQGNRPVNALHKEAVHYVKADAQAAIIETVMGQLTEEEAGVYRRGKNAKPHTTSKNGTVGDYHKATGFEALIGYLYLKNEFDRILELVHTGIAGLTIKD